MGMEDALDTVMFLYSCFPLFMCLCDEMVYGDVPQNGR